MRKRVARAEKTEETRQKLLAAARTVFLRRGFHASSLDLVAEEAGFTKGAVYSRYKSKADLFLAVLEVRIEQRIAEMRQAAASKRGILEAAVVLGRQWDEKVRDDRQWSLLLIEFRLHAARTPSVNRRYAAIHARLRSSMARDIEEAARGRGETLPLPAEQLARFALAVGTGAMLEQLAEPDAPAPHLTESVLMAMLQGLIGAAAPATVRRKRTAA